MVLKSCPFCARQFWVPVAVAFEAASHGGAVFCDPTCFEAARSGLVGKLSWEAA